MSKVNMFLHVCNCYFTAQLSRSSLSFCIPCVISYLLCSKQGESCPNGWNFRTFPQTDVLFEKLVFFSEFFIGDYFFTYVERENKPIPLTTSRKFYLFKSVYYEWKSACTKNICVDSCSGLYTANRFYRTHFSQVGFLLVREHSSQLPSSFRSGTVELYTHQAYVIDL